MVAAILAILAGLMQALPTLLEIYQKWKALSPVRDKEKDYAAFDKALASGDAAQLARMFDELDSLHP